MSTSKFTILGSLASGVVLGLVVVFVLFHSRDQRVVNLREQSKPYSAESVPAVSPEPGQMDVQWTSPEGNKTLTLKSIDAPEGGTTYSFFVTDNKENPQTGEKLIYTKTVAEGSSMSVPFNSWSPGNKYFFIQEHSQSGTQNFVLTSNGTVFQNKENILDVNAIFSEKIADFEFAEATGWTSPTMLIINTKTTDLEQGPTFWFDVTRSTFTKLSTKF